MIDYVSVRAVRLATLACVVGGVLAIATLTPQPAHAEQFCWGYYLPKLEATCHLNHERYASEVWGMGKEKSVCVWQQPIGPIRCSGGADVWVQNYYGTDYWGVPYIQDNASNGTYAYGEVF
jgi:hypothetical protein